MAARSVRPGGRVALAGSGGWRESSPECQDSRLPGTWKPPGSPPGLRCSSSPFHRPGARGRGRADKRLPAPGTLRTAPSLQPAQFWDTLVGHPSPCPDPTPPGGRTPATPRESKEAQATPSRPVPSPSANRYGRRSRQPAHSGARARHSPGLWARCRGADGGKRRGRERAGGCTHLWLGRGRPRGPAAPKPGFRGASARAGGFLRGPQGGGGAGGGAGGQRSASHSHPRPAAAAPRRHPRCSRLPRRPGLLPKRAPGSARAPRRLGARCGRAPLVLVLGSRLGTLPRTPARRAALPLPLPLAVQSPGARAQPMCAAASLRPEA